MNPSSFEYYLVLNHRKFNSFFRGNLMQKTPKVSVLMPVYNAEKFLHESVESILNQTFKDFEFIIINDGSTDKSEYILQEFQKQDSRIKLISRTNKGIVSTRNQGLAEAKGIYIALMDADDIALPDRLAKQIEFLDANLDYVAIGSRVLLIDPEGWPICPFAKSTSHEEIDEAHLRCQGGAICNPSALLRFDAVARIGGYRPEIKSAEDIDLFLRLAEVGKIINLSEILLKYRQHPKSIGHSQRAEQKQFADLAVMEAYQRRGLKVPAILNTVDGHNASISEMRRKWAWWALGANNIATARKNAFLALSKNPISSENWKVMACALRGY